MESWQVDVIRDELRKQTAEANRLHAEAMARPAAVSLRDYFAAAALPEAMREVWTARHSAGVDDARTVADAAYALADAMLTTRDEKP